MTNIFLVSILKCNCRHIPLEWVSNSRRVAPITVWRSGLGLGRLFGVRSEWNFKWVTLWHWKIYMKVCSLTPVVIWDPLSMVWGQFLEEIFQGERARFTSWWCYANWIWVQHNIYDSPLISWPTSQPVDGFLNKIAIFMKAIDFQSSNGVYLQRRVTGNIFSIHKENKNTCMHM